MYMSNFVVIYIKNSICEHINKEHFNTNCGVAYWYFPSRLLRKISKIQTQDCLKSSSTWLIDWTILSKQRGYSGYFKQKKMEQYHTNIKLMLLIFINFSRPSFHPLCFSSFFLYLKHCLNSLQIYLNFPTFKQRWDPIASSVKWRLAGLSFWHSRTAHATGGISNS